jgi:hypothetical protein
VTWFLLTFGLILFGYHGRFAGGKSTENLLESLAGKPRYKVLLIFSLLAVLRVPGVAAAIAHERIPVRVVAERRRAVAGPD